MAEVITFIVNGLQFPLRKVRNVGNVGCLRTQGSSSPSRRTSPLLRIVGVHKPERLPYRIGKLYICSPFRSHQSSPSSRTSVWYKSPSAPELAWIRLMVAVGPLWPRVVHSLVVRPSAPSTAVGSPAAAGPCHITGLRSCGGGMGGEGTLLLGLLVHLSLNVIVSF